MKAIKILIGVILSSVLFGCTSNNLNNLYTTTPFTLIGCAMCDVESKAHVNEPDADFWLEHISKTERSLVPKNGTTAAISHDMDYDSISVDYIKSRTLSENMLVDTDANGGLAQGTIVIFKTGQGNYGKLQVMGFKSLQDFSVYESLKISEEWKALALSEVNVENYHMLIKWQLLK